MKKDKNNKGFTLIELLVVIVILIAIVSLAIPSITSSMERNKEKVKDGKIQTIGSEIELYLSEKGTNEMVSEFSSGGCYISINDVKAVIPLNDDQLKDADNNAIDGDIFNSDNKYVVVASSSISPCTLP